MKKRKERQQCILQGKRPVAVRYDGDVEGTACTPLNCQPLTANRQPTVVGGFPTTVGEYATAVDA